MAPEKSHLETNVLCLEKLIARLKTVVVSKDHRGRERKMKDLNKYFS